MEFLNNIWVEKYRPKKIEDLVLPDVYRKDFEKCIYKKEIGNLLFYGPPGGGKTVLSRILSSKNGVLNNPRDNLLEINGSAKKSRGINFVDDVIEPFLKIPPAGQDNYRIVFIDEADYLTDASFNSLRYLINKYQEESGRFIFTCNYISKIPEPIQSRFMLYSFKQLPIEFVVNYCKEILKSESIPYEDYDIKFIVDNLYPDIRRIVNLLQKSSLSGKLFVNRELITTNEKVLISNIVEIISLLEKGEKHKISQIINNILNLLNDFDLDYRGIYSSLFFTSNIPSHAKIIINKYTNSHSNCLVPSMNFMSMIFEIIKVLNEYRNTILNGKH